jgi:rhodanese-related sulfurtransferase
MPHPSKRTPKTSKTGKTGVTYQNSRTKKSIRTVWLVAVILIGIFGIGFLIVQIVGEFAPWQLSDEISPDQARKQLDNGAIVLDVRTYDEFVSGHIEKSLFMPLADLNSLMAALPRNRLIIIVCRTGLRSIQARYILQEAGFTQVTSLKGGLEAWIALGYPIVYGEPIRNN